LLTGLIASIDKVEVQLRIGYGAAADLSAGAGAKARLHGSAVGRVTFDRDVTDMVRARLSAGLLRAAELLDILRGSLDDAPTEVRIGPDQLAASPR
jgi:hypothetical protein